MFYVTNTFSSLDRSLYFQTILKKKAASEIQIHGQTKEIKTFYGFLDIEVTIYMF